MNTADDRVLMLVARADPVPGVDDQAHSGAHAIALRDRILSGHVAAVASRRPRRSSRSAAAAAGVASVLVAGGVAAATGLVPSGVTHYFETVSPHGATITRERMLVEHVSSNGIRDQLWVARDSAGQRCQEQRSVSRSGRVEDASVGCESVDPNIPKPPVEKLTAGLSTAGKTWPSLTYDVIAHTTLRTAVRLEIVYPDGRHYGLTYNPRNGWAIGVVPPAVTAMRSVLLVRDSSGTVIARKRLAATTP